jgi:hypothetical protein
MYQTGQGVPKTAPIAVCRRNGNGTITVGRVRVGKEDTTISVELEFWDQFRLITMMQRTTISRLLAEINQTMRLLPYQGPPDRSSWPHCSTTVDPTLPRAQASAGSIQLRSSG